MDAEIRPAMLIGRGEPPKGAIAGMGLASVWPVAKRTGRIDADADRMVIQAGKRQFMRV